MNTARNRTDRLTNTAPNRLSPEQEAKLLREYPEPATVQKTLDSLTYDDVVRGAFGSSLALAIHYHGFVRDVNGSLPERVWQVLVASKVRRSVKTGWVRVMTGKGKAIGKSLHPESKPERSELVSAVIAERLGVKIPSDRTRKYSERPAVCTASDNYMWGLPSVIVSADRYLFNKGTPYWSTKHYTKGPNGIGWVEVKGRFGDDDIADSNVFAHHGMPLTSHYQAPGTLLVDTEQNMIQSKIIVRHLGDTASQYPNMSHEEFADVRALVGEELGERGLVVWDLLARGSFTIRQIATVCSASDRFVYDVIEAARKGTGRDVVGDDDTRTGIEQASSRARYRTPAVQRSFRTKRVPNTKPTLTERLQGITDCLTRPATQTEPEQFDSFNDWYLHGTKNTRTSWLPVQKATKL